MQNDFENATEKQTAQQTKAKKPGMYNVVLMNDDYTSMDFVVDVLQHVFNRSANDAAMVTLDVHKKGKGVANAYPYTLDEAQTRIEVTHEAAKVLGYPLLAVAEPAPKA